MRAWKHWGKNLLNGNYLAALEASVEYKHVRRSLVHRYVAKKPTVRERVALDNCARLLTRCHFASGDPSVSPDMLSKLNSSARHALEALKLVAAERVRPRRNPNPVRLLMAEDLRL
jgi:hypothetical protein